MAEHRATRELIARLRIAHDAGAGYHITAAEMEMLLAAAEVGASELKPQEAGNDRKRA